MTTDTDQKDPHRERFVLAALAACCVGPMLAIIVLTSVAGIAVGTAAAITLGVVAAVVCVVIMAGRHGGHGHTGGHEDAAA